MKRESTVRRVKITDEIRDAYANRDRSLETEDAPSLPPEMWEGAILGKYYRPKKTPITLRVDNDVLAWLKSKGEGHLSRINELLRQQMIAELSREAPKKARR